jgi:glycosyltransferase involved in cell wall biosynthesis
MTFSVVVPVFNELSVLQLSVPALLLELESHDVELVYVCNGCVDGSAKYLRETLAGRGLVVDLAEASKTEALNRGDAVATSFPRFYLDADVVVSVGVFEQLLSVLKSGRFDLVSPHVLFDKSLSSKLAAMIMGVWESLPHGQLDGFHHLLGLSRRGRQLWGRFPRITGDDAFITSHIPTERRKVVTEAVVSTWAPRTYWSWVKVRARWARGHRELREMGIREPQTPSQGKALLRLLGRVSSWPGVLLYLSARSFGLIYNFATRRSRVGWYRDRGGESTYRRT